MTDLAAKKGDLAVLEVLRSYNTANTYARHESTRFYVAEVAATDRAGQARKFQFSGGRPQDKPSGTVRVLIAPASAIDVKAAVAGAASDGYETIQQATDHVKEFKR